MPTFATPQPVSATIELIAGNARVTASQRTDTVVEVHPRDTSNANDVKAAATARVEYHDGKLTIKAARPLHTYFTSRVGTIDVTIELPAGSHIRGHTAYGEFLGEGDLGDCWFTTTFGDIGLGQAGAVRLTTLDGQITVDRAVGDSHVTGSGEIRIGEIIGAASIKNLNGHSRIGAVTGDISLNSAHGDITVGSAGASVVARTAFGDVRIGAVTRGTVVIQSASGALEVGIRTGTAAWLNVKSSSGRIRNNLDSTDGPEQASETVEVRARTYDGDITIGRAIA